jgi:tryptophan halogenase
MREEITFIRDFIVLHYHANEHQEAPFWTAMANLDIPDTLAHRIELFRETGRVFQAQGDVFGENSWTQVMLGQGIMPKRYHHIVDMMSEPELRDFMSRQHNKVNQILDVLPNHQDFLDAYVGNQ